MVHEGLYNPLTRDQQRKIRHKIHKIILRKTVQKYYEQLRFSHHEFT